MTKKKIDDKIYLPLLCPYCKTGKLFYRKGNEYNIICERCNSDVPGPFTPDGARKVEYINNKISYDYIMARPIYWVPMEWVEYEGPGFDSLIFDSFELCKKRCEKIGNNWVPSPLVLHDPPGMEVLPLKKLPWCF